MSCEFTPSEEYFSDIDEPTAPELQIDLNINDKNPVIFYWPGYIRLNFNNTDIELYQVNFYLDSTKLETLGKNPNYYANINLLDTLNHKFKIELITSTGSNSIADSYGTEGFIYTSKEWTLMPVDINTSKNWTISLINNGLLLSWKTYDGLNFKTYRIKKTITGEVYETPSNSFQDEGFIGANGQYSIYVIDEDNIEHLWAEPSFSKSFDLRIEELNNLPYLKWNTAGFENSVKEYTISYKNPLLSSWNYYTTFNPTTNNFFLYNDFKFGDEIDFKLSISPKDNDEIYETTKSFIIGVPCASNFYSNYGTTTNGYAYKNNDSIYFYSISSNQSIPIFPKDCNIIISPDAEYVIIPKENTLDLYSLNNFKFLKSLEINSYNQNSTLKITDNGFLALASENNIYIYDMINEEMVVQKSYDTNYNMIISPNGQYLILYSGNIAITNEIINNSIVKIDEITKPVGTYDSNDFLLIPNDPNNFYYIHLLNDIEIKSFKDLSIQRTITGNGDNYTTFCNIDFSSNKVLFLNSVAKNFYVQDFITGDLLEEVPTDIYNYSESLLLYNNIIIYKGYKFYLNN